MSNNTNWQATTSTEVLQSRARLYQQIREFMMARNIMEVDTPILSTAGITDPFIEMVTANARVSRHQSLYLHTSPEFCMKRLLASGSGDIFQLTRVFRDDEQGRAHTLEFTMLEWYRLNFDYRQLMQEVAELIDMLGIARPTMLSYSEVFQQVLGVNPLEADDHLLHDMALQAGWDNAVNDRHQLLDYLFTHLVNPEIRSEKSLFIYDYPACMSALSRLKTDDNRVCERFELFINGMEIANGFTELIDANEQRRRFEQELDIRKKQGKPAPPIDEYLIAAMESGLPDCAGVAVGIDRLLMILLEVDNIRDIQAFTLDNN